MPTLDMRGPYPLDARTVEAWVARASPGTFALGWTAPSGGFLVVYVGRSDSDIRSFLTHVVGKTSAPIFQFSYAPSPRAAFDKECRAYHDFNPPGNPRHPQRTKTTDWQCPRCDAFAPPPDRAPVAAGTRRRWWWPWCLRHTAP